MNKFEAVLMFSSEISETVRKKNYDNFTKLINDNSGEVVASEDWGLRDLSYNIGNLSKAFYNFFQIEIDGSKIDSLKRSITLNENCIRHLFIKTDNHQELPTKLINEKK